MFLFNNFNMFFFFMQLRCNTAKKAFLITEGFIEEIGCFKENQLLYCTLQTAQMVEKKVDV